MRAASPRKLLVILVATIFSAELLVMSLLHFLDIPALVEIAIDSTLLVLLLMPLLLRAVVYPMQARIDALAVAEQALRKASSELERRVDERTAALSAANEALQHEIAERSRMQEELKRLAESDTLTGLYNRRAFEEFAAHEFSRCERHGDALSLILLDIDHFKRINDTHGHHIGDEVLLEISTLIGKRIRSSDIFARWGGEEFILLVTKSVLDDAVRLANSLRELLQAHRFDTVGTVTTSMGVTQYSKGDDLDSMLQRADAALYRAKANGRNQVVAEPFLGAA